MIYAKDNNYELHKGTMQEVLSTLPEKSIDSIVTDPPYELNFMNKGWDNSGVAFQKDTWEHCLRVLKPGGYLLAFGGSRTFHRIACAIEDAGFEIRDCIMWLYGSGFPKSMNIGLAIDKKNGVESEKVYTINTHAFSSNSNKKFANIGSGESETKNINIYKATNEWNGWGTCLKPAFEPIIVARKPCENSCVENVIKYGVGGVNIDECRVEPTGEDIGRNNKVSPYSSGRTMGISSTPPVDSTGRYDGRFPANVILTYDDTDFNEVCGGFPTNDKPNGNITKKYKINNQICGDYGYCNTWDAYQDSGSASRYFYCAKASKKDRDEGLDCFEEKNMRLEQNREIHSAGCEYIENGVMKQNPHLQSSIKRNTHPTVKPTELMQYLVRLVSPKGSTILDCFMGSGSTGKAVMFENRERNANYKFIGVEMTEEYLPIAEARIKFAICYTPTIDIDFENKPMQEQLTMF